MCLHLKSVATQTRFEKPRRHDQCAHNDELTLLSKANTIQQSYVNSAFTPATSVQVKSQIKGVQHGRLYQRQQARRISALIHIGQRCTKSNERHDQRRASATQLSRQTQRRPKAVASRLLLTCIFLFLRRRRLGRHMCPSITAMSSTNWLAYVFAG